MRALHKKKSVKAIVISGVSLLLAAAIVVGVLWYLGHRSDPVKVAPVSMLMGWLSNESTQSGNVTADNLQKIYASDTQTVTALLVQEGQTVKKGDPLFRYDTTLSDIQVERQEIAVKQDGGLELFFLFAAVYCKYSVVGYFGNRLAVILIHFVNARVLGNRLYGKHTVGGGYKAHTLSDVCVVRYFFGYYIHSARKGFLGGIYALFFVYVFGGVYNGILTVGRLRVYNIG